jgi:hypothetical protein
MLPSDSPSHSSLKRVLQFAGLILILLSIIPCLCTLVNVAPTIQFSIETGQSHALQIVLPLLAAAVLNGLGVAALLISLILHGN